MPSRHCVNWASRPPVRRSSWVLRHHPTLPRYAPPLSFRATHRLSPQRALQVREELCELRGLAATIFNTIKCQIPFACVSRVVGSAAFARRSSCRVSLASRVVAIAARGGRAARLVRRRACRARGRGVWCVSAYGASRAVVVSRVSRSSRRALVVLLSVVASRFGLRSRAACAVVCTRAVVGAARPDRPSVASLAVSRAAPLVTRFRTDPSARTSS